MIEISTFLQLLNDAEDYADTREQIDIDNLNYYLRNARGDERPNESKAVSSDCFDVVNADMPSLVRSFLGGSDIMEFKPNSANNKAEIIEAKQKTTLVNRLILGQDWSFKVLHDWMLSAEIYTMSAVTYYPKIKEREEVKIYEGINQVELEQITQALESNDDIKKAEIVSDDGGETFDAEIKIIRESTEYCIECIDPHDFLISKGGPTLEDCAFVGHRTQYRKSELLELGIDEDKVKDLPSQSNSSSAPALTGTNSDSLTKDIAERALGVPTDAEVAPEWHLEQVDVVVACVLSSTEGGSVQRRRVMYAGSEIIQDEPFDHVNYAVLSAYPLPNQVGGLSRVGITKRTQDEKTFVQRGLFNNMSAVNKPMTAINIQQNGQLETVNRQDILNRRTNGVVRVNGPVTGNILPLPVPSIGAECLQLIQYIDFNRSQTTGSLMASQGLNRDDVYNETATRFKGVSDEGAAKLEMVMRVYAETGWRKLYRGFEWMLKTYQDATIEEQILGEEIAYSPADWKFSASCVSGIGLAASDSSEMIENLGVIYNTQKELAASGSPLVDQTKMYNTLTKILKAMNVHDNGAFYNDPDQPSQVVQAQNEQMKTLIQQLQQQLEASSVNSVLSENERLKQQVKALEDSTKAQIEAAKIAEGARQFNEELELKRSQGITKTALDITRLELENNTQLEGGLDEQ